MNQQWLKNLLASSSSLQSQSWVMHEQTKLD